MNGSALRPTNAFICLHSGWPNGCSSYRVEGATVRPTNVCAVSRQTVRGIRTEPSTIQCHKIWFTQAFVSVAFIRRNFHFSHPHSVPDDEERHRVGGLEVVEVGPEVDVLVLGEEREDEGGKDPGVARVL